MAFVNHNKEHNMQQPIHAENRTDDMSHPSGGYVEATGLHIQWQEGPLGRDGERQDPNGAFVETVIYAAKQRIEHYQESMFSCRENAIAITKLDEALHWLQHRTAAREERQVEGTHAV